MKRNVLRNLLVSTTLGALALFPAGCFDTGTTVTDGGMGSDSGVPAEFQSIYASTTFQMCKDCHAPGAPGFTVGTETTQNWTTSTTAFTTLKGNAAGLVGNFAACNGVPLVGPTSSQSLIVAIFDPTVRAGFSYPGHPGCDGTAITDETLRVGAIPPALLTQLKAFIDAGGFQ
ncbi:MAG: hypothetical protein U0230_11920 [Polyangiales bacterium]